MLSAFYKSGDKALHRKHARDNPIDESAYQHQSTNVARVAVRIGRQGSDNCRQHLIWKVDNTAFRRFTLHLVGYRGDNRAKWFIVQTTLVTIQATVAYIAHPSQTSPCLDPNQPQHNSQ